MGRIVLRGRRFRKVEPSHKSFLGSLNLPRNRFWKAHLGARSLARGAGDADEPAQDTALGQNEPPGRGFSARPQAMALKPNPIGYGCVITHCCLADRRDEATRLFRKAEVLGMEFVKEIASGTTIFSKFSSRVDFEI